MCQHVHPLSAVLLLTTGCYIGLNLLTLADISYQTFRINKCLFVPVLTGLTTFSDEFLAVVSGVRMWIMHINLSTLD